MIPNLVSVQKIWSEDLHCAMPDLIRFKDTWFCVFRESDAHVHGRNGTIQIIASKDGEKWEEVGHFDEKLTDLRDPKLSITPDGKLMLLLEGVIYHDEKYVVRQPQVIFSDDGFAWSEPHHILEPHEWLWRVTWHEGKAYGVSYRSVDPTQRNSEWVINLYESANGKDYKLITPLEIEGRPNETTLRFTKEGQMVALVRRERRGHNKAVIGHSDYPYKQWKWVETKYHFGGPNFLILPNDTMWAGGRLVFKNPYGYLPQTVIAEMGLGKLRPMLMLPSGGDCSYPAMVFHDGYLWVAYYSSHEGNRTSIYLAKIQFKP